MKGITHFAVGVAVASCFPDAVEAGTARNPLYFVLGGALALLPDTIDFKFIRFLVKRDMEVAPDPNAPDPQMIADAVACAVNNACRTGKPVRLKLDTIRLGADRWRRYTVRFDVAKRQVAVKLGPVVSSGGIPEDGDGPAQEPEARAALACPVALDYEAVSTIDIFDGPMFRMTPAADGRVRPEFMFWHRRWTHGIAAGLLLSAVAALLWGPLAGLVALAAWCSHIAVDQLGFMGSAVFAPFKRARLPGLMLTHSGSAPANAAITWACCLLVFWNLYKAVPAQTGRLNLAQLFLFGGALPAAVLWGIDKLLLRRREAQAAPDQ